jgi:hypothetical protein
MLVSAVLATSKYEKPNNRDWFSDMPSRDSFPKLLWAGIIFFIGAIIGGFLFGLGGDLYVLEVTCIA